MNILVVLQDQGSFLHSILKHSSIYTTVFKNKPEKTRTEIKMMLDTNLNPVKDPLIVRLVLMKSVQLLGQLCWAHLLPALLRLFAQSELNVLQKE